MRKLLKLLFSEGRTDEAYELARHCLVHDNSKLKSAEMSNFIELSNARKGMLDAKELMTDREKQIISLHWEHNRHHPEHSKIIMK